jgi:hypothetical protein
MSPARKAPTILGSTGSSPPRRIVLISPNWANQRREAAESSIGRLAAPAPIG